MDAIMDFWEWPIYVSDIGCIYCNYANCSDGWTWSEIGRRTNVDEFLKTLVQHAKETHNVKVVYG